MPPAGPSRVLIVGCGSSLRRDDQAGLRIGESLAKEEFPVGAEVLLTESPAVDVPALLEGRSDIGLLVVVDAAAAGENHPPGTWRRFDYLERPRPTACPPDTANPALSEAMENPAPIGALVNLAPSGAAGVSPGRKPWVRDTSTSPKPRRGDRADLRETFPESLPDRPRDLMRDQIHAPAISRCHTNLDNGPTSREDAPYDIHGPGVEAAIRLCASLGSLPAEVWVYAIAAGDTGYGEELSAPVSTAVETLADQIREDVRGWSAERSCEGA